MTPYTVKSLPSSDVVQTEARLARAVSNVSYLEQLASSRQRMLNIGQ